MLLVRAEKGHFALALGQSGSYKAPYCSGSKNQHVHDSSFRNSHVVKMSV